MAIPFCYGQGEEGTVRDLATYDSNTDTTTIANHRVYDAYGNVTSETAKVKGSGVFNSAVVDPSGTISEKYYDSLGRLTSVWVGADNQPGTSNMVVMIEYQYDNNDVGDGNLTQMTVHPGSGQDDRVSQWLYDWRDRQIVSKQGVETSESTSVNRPITYRVLDNLGEVLETTVYDGDGVSLAGLGFTDGVPNAPSASLRRSQSTTAYDDQGRAYQTSVKVVDQSNGDILSTQTTDYWYGRRGQTIKIESPEGAVAKYQYDGAGRLVLDATTDGGGDATWADAGNLTGDTVLTHTHYAYDDDGNQTGVTDALDNTTTYAYDSLNRLETQTDANDAVTSYAYDDAGRLLSLTDPESNATSWTYDMLGRKTQETNSLDDDAYWTYNALGQILTRTDYSGRVITYTYNYLGQQTAENWLDAQQNVIRTIAYTYDSLGNLESAREDIQRADEIGE